MDGYTYCFFTNFVCGYESLGNAKLRHKRCVEVLRDF